jgi:hypothetical protein
VSGEIKKFDIDPGAFDESVFEDRVTFGPFVAPMLEQFKEQFGETEITEIQMCELFGGGDATTVADLTPLQLIQFAFASALRSNEALLKQQRINRLTAATAPFRNRQQRRHGGR